MTTGAAIGTLNATIGEIEDLLDKGQSIDAIVRELQEPKANVLAVWQRWRVNRGDIAPPARPIAVPTPLPGMSSQTVLSLVAAAEQSSSRSTRVMGERLQSLAVQVRERLAEEREVAEAAAEVARLEAALAEAREKVRGRTVTRREPRPRRTPPDVAGELPCRKECGRTSSTPQGRAAHERHCDGTTS